MSGSAVASQPAASSQQSMLLRMDGTDTPVRHWIELVDQLLDPAHAGHTP